MSTTPEEPGPLESPPPGEARSAAGSSRRGTGVVLLNVLIPGAGWVVRGREAAGAGLGIGFVTALHVMIAAWLFAPLGIARWAGPLAAVTAAGLWFAGQAGLPRASDRPSD